MPYASIEKRRAAAREGMRKQRAAAKSAKLKATPAAHIPKQSSDPIGDLAKWSRKSLVVPPGHGAAGKPMVLPDFGERFLRDAITHRESLLCVARKNAKSAVIAVYLLGRLVGPIRTDGYRAGVCSISREKAGELRRQMLEIAEASDLRGLRFLRSPAPGRVESSSGTADFLSADRSSGHASGFDDALIDELGLLPERHRELVNGMRTATSARDGKFIALSIQGDSPFTAEMIERAGGRCAVHHYSAPEDCALDDAAAWRAANPSLGIIKSLSYMRDESERVQASPADQASFRAFDLNLPQDPTRVMICSVPDWRACEGEPPARDGYCVLGFDAGGTTSMTALCALWPGTGRMECWGAFGDKPNLKTRGMADGVGDLYQRMAQRGELATYPGRVTDVAAFLGDCMERLAGQRVMSFGADRHRRGEVETWMDQAGVGWPIEWRGTGASASADGSHDVRAFQRGVLRRDFRVSESLLMRSAIASSTLRFDKAGNPALDKAGSTRRIDALQAAVIAAGLGEIAARRPRRTWRYRGAA